MEKTVEICCGSFEDALKVYEAGAKRIELNSALYLGGLTPGIGTLILTKAKCRLEVIAMVRPRGAGFCYTPYEYETMLADCRMLLEHGADGIAYGFLNEDRTIDETRTEEFTKLIHSFGKQAVFHRAFDCVDKPEQAVELLIRLGVDRILTSGLQEKAKDGIALLKNLQTRYGSQIEFLAGSGIHAENATVIMEQTGISQVHSSCKKWIEDPTTKGQNVSYAYGAGELTNSYDVVSKELVIKLLQAVNQGDE